MADEDDPSALIDARIAALGDWRGETLARLRRLIREADPEIVETVKWRKPSNPMGVPVWERGGILCTGETYKDKVKLTFAKGASLDDPKGLFNASLDGGTRRAIDIREGETVDAAAFKALVRAAAALNDPPARRETQRRKALERWEDEGGSEPDGPQVPGVGPMPHVEPVKRKR